MKLEKNEQSNLNIVQTTQNSSSKCDTNVREPNRCEERCEVLVEILKPVSQSSFTVKSGPTQPPPPPGPSSLRPTNVSVAEHWPKKLDEVMRNGCRVRRRCKRCSQAGVTRRTSFVCCVCDVPLCLEPCFKLYHSYFPSPRTSVKSRRATKLLPFLNSN